jgi:queuosine precursor transporter
MLGRSRKELVYLVLAGMFVANALLGEILGGKLIQVAGFVMSIGVIPWPVVFVTSDLVNEYFGREGVKRLTMLTAALIAYAFVVIFLTMQVPAAAVSPVQDAAFISVLGQSMWIIVGSLAAFLVSQMVDVVVFWAFRKRTGHKFLWLRATGSTAVSQLIDTFVVMGIGFWLPGKLTTTQYLNVSMTNYVYKFAIALGTTPLLYVIHAAVDKFLGKTEADHLADEAAAIEAQQALSTGD